MDNDTEGAGRRFNILMLAAVLSKAVAAVVGSPEARGGKTGTPAGDVDRDVVRLLVLTRQTGGTGIDRTTA